MPGVVTHTHPQTGAHNACAAARAHMTSISCPTGSGGRRHSGAPGHQRLLDHKVTCMLTRDSRPHRLVVKDVALWPRQPRLKSWCGHTTTVARRSGVHLGTRRPRLDFRPAARHCSIAVQSPSEHRHAAAQARPASGLFQDPSPASVCFSAKPTTTRGVAAVDIGQLKGSQSLHRLVVRTSRCGRDNPGSNPGVDTLLL